MEATELTAAADSLAATTAGLDTGELEVSKQGRAFLAGAEAALRATAGTPAAE